MIYSKLCNFANSRFFAKKKIANGEVLLRAFATWQEAQFIALLTDNQSAVGSREITICEVELLNCFSGKKSIVERKPNPERRNRHRTLKYPQNRLPEDAGSSILGRRTILVYAEDENKYPNLFVKY